MAVQLTIEDDVALVLFGLLASERLDAVVEVPERNALWALAGVLDKQLAEPFHPEYAALLDQARTALVTRYGD